MEERARLTRRGFLSLSAMAATGALLAACQPAVPAAPTAAPQATSAPAATEVPAATPEAPKGPVTLRYVYVADTGEKEVREACIDDFTKKYPDIKINGELVPEDGMGEKILTQLAGGAAPDVVYFNNTPLPLYASENVLIPVDDYADRDSGTFKADDFFPGPVKALSFRGKVYGYPYYSGPWMQIYNKTLFDKLGVPYPSTYSQGFEQDQDKWTWENMLGLAKQLSTGEGVERTYGYNPSRHFIALYKTWMPGWGAKPWNEDRTKPLMNEPAAVECVQFMVDLIVKHKVTPTSAELQGLPDGFLSGRIGIQAMLKASVPEYKNATFELGEMTECKGPVARSSRDGPNAVGIVSSCKDKDAAWVFASYLPGNAPGVLGGQEFEFKAGRSVPTRKSNFASKVFLDNLLPWEDPAAYRSAAEHVYEIEVPAKLPEIMKVWVEQFDLMTLQGKPVKQAMDDLCAAMEPLLKEG